MARGMAVEIVLTDSEREELGQRVRRRKIGRADAMRAEIVLLAADGLNNCAIADRQYSRRSAVFSTASYATGMLTCDADF
jgi:hypothetical protein